MGFAGEGGMTGEYGFSGKFGGLALKGRRLPPFSALGHQYACASREGSRLNLRQPPPANPAGS